MSGNERDQDEKPPSRIPQSAAAVAGAVAGWRLGPAGALAGAAAGPYLVDFARQVWDEVTPDAQRRQGEMLGAAAKAAGQDLEGLADMIGQSERTRLMAGIAMTGAARTAWPPKVYGLGRAMADGLIAADEAQINLADLVLPAMTGMDRPHVSLLELLVRWIPDQVAGQPLGLRAHQDLPPYAPGEAWHVGQRAWTASQIGDVRPALRPAVSGHAVWT